MENFFLACLSLIEEPDPKIKCAKIKHLYQKIEAGINFDFTKTASILSIIEPGRPAKPELVSPLNVPRRRLGTKEGHASLIHALTHIEFNTTNLALDACYRFQDMPHEYYINWLEVANDEAYHFSLLDEHLQTLGYKYGDFPAHNGLWDMAIKTESDCMARMAMVPRVLEARGIDAVPEMRQKISQLNDAEGCKILAIIHADEITHVSYGDKWFKFLCDRKGLNSEKTFFELFAKYDAPKIRGAFNRTDRKKAGFSDHELDKLSNIIKESYA